MLAPFFLQHNPLQIILSRPDFMILANQALINLIKRLNKKLLSGDLLLSV